MSMKNGGYLGRVPGNSAVVLARQNYAPSGVTTDFTFSSGYTVGYIDAYINGVRLIYPDDYEASDGSTVGLTTAATNGDVVELVAYKAFNVGNVTDATGNFTVGSKLTVSGDSIVTNIDSAGITTSTGGFVSAASTSACKITFSGQTLTFTVAGVGATSLTLY
tara:strand:+ start:576 stop:1064 length:489 start_codon:yes stop_codon:yes gene_type:complete